MPPAIHLLSESSALPGASHSYRQQTDRRPIDPGHLCVGCIVWLPPRNSHHSSVKCDRKGCCDGDELEDPGYDHPVVVLSIRQKTGSVQLGDLVCSVACVSPLSGN